MIIKLLHTGQRLLTQLIQYSIINVIHFMKTLKPISFHLREDQIITLKSADFQNEISMDKEECLVQ